MSTQPRLGNSNISNSVEMKTMPDHNVKEELRKIFGETLEEQEDRVRITSIYSGLTTW